MTDAVEQPGSCPEAAADAVGGLNRLSAAGGFGRPAVSILGLPFDAVNLDQAVELIRNAAFAGRRCFVSTPNLNFAISAWTDPAFRDTVLRSDLNLVDGMPLVWIARLLRLPIDERVAGADLFEALQAHRGPPVTVYLFGGPVGAGAVACDSINRRAGGVRCVGHDAAGFGSVESMSSVELIERINRSGAHFVIASLGAKKGQAWLERNASQLAAPVLSHLGAVLNFAAGTVRRAPRRMRWLGLEWLWRIKEEPELWRRYWQDGTRGFALLVTRVVPDMVASRAVAASLQPPTLSTTASRAGGTTLHLEGAWHDRACTPLRGALAAAAHQGVTHLTIELSKVTGVGNTFVALCLIARGHFGSIGTLTLIGARQKVVASFRNKLADHLLTDGPP